MKTTIHTLFSFSLLVACTLGCGRVDQKQSSDGGDNETTPCGDDSTARPDGWNVDTHCKGVAPNYENLFDDTVVNRIDISISRENYELTMDNLSGLGGGGGPGGPGGPGGGFGSDEPIWAPVTIRFDGNQWNYVGMRYKGNSSLHDAVRKGVKKIGFRLSFDRYEEDHPEINDQRFYGFKKMTFSNGFLDNSLIRDKLAADVFRAGGVPAARSAFVRVYLDTGNEPVYMGLYTMIEDVSNKFINTQFEDGAGNLYKPDGRGARLDEFRERDLYKKTNEEENDFSDVAAFISALNGPRSNPDAWRQNLESTFDVPTFLKFLALNQIMINWDTYGWMTHNYYLYQDHANGGRLTWIPWDLNEAFLDKGDPSARDIHLQGIGNEWPLIRYLLDDEVYREAYYQALESALENEFSFEFVKGKMEAYHNLIQPYVTGDEKEQFPYTMLDSHEAFDNSLYDNRDGLIPHLEHRIAEAHIALGY